MMINLVEEDGKRYTIIKPQHFIVGPGATAQFANREIEPNHELLGSFTQLLCDYIYNSKYKITK